MAIVEENLVSIHKLHSFKPFNLTTLQYAKPYNMDSQNRFTERFWLWNVL